MGLDARLRYTRMVIKNSFVELLKKRPINKITVKEICDKAEINRATFYKHYLDVYDLLDKLKEKIVQANEKSFSETLSFIMEALKADAEIYKSLFSDHGDPMFPKKVFDICYELDLVMDKSAANEQLSPTQKRWLYDYIAYGCNGILSQWIAENMQEPISVVVEFAEQLVKSTMRNR